MKSIDLDSWNRREIYEHFSKLENPFYSVTIPLNVTNVKAVSKSKSISFYHLMIWVCTKAVNAVPAFNMRIRNNAIYELPQTHPSFSAMEKGDDIFKFIRLPWVEDYSQFSLHANALSAKQEGLFDKTEATDDKIYFTCAPWFDFTALSLVRTSDTADTIPRLAFGKYYSEGDALFMHFSLDVNHRTIDGYHIGKLKEAIDREIETLK